MSKSIWIAFSHGGIIPAAITGGEEKKVGPHEPVEVPAAYGQHLVDDRFAYKTEKPAAPKGGKGGAKQDTAKAARAAELGAAVDDLKKAVEAASDIEAKTKLAADLAAAEEELKALEAA